MVHLFFIIVVAFAFIPRNVGKFSLIFSFSGLFIFSALRYMYGNDYGSYYKHHSLIQAGGTVFDEPLFVLLNKAIPNYFLFIAFISLLFLSVVFFLIQKVLPKQYMWIGVFIFVVNPYLFLVNLSALRQCMAMVFFVMAVYFAERKKYVFYILFVLFAVCFHKSAIILFPVLLFIVFPKRIDKKFYVLYLSVMAFLFFTPYLYDGLEYIVKKFDDPNYIAYLKQGTTNSLRATLLSAVTLVYVLINLRELKGKELVYGKMYLLASTFSVLAYRLSMFTRIQMYFDIFSVVALPVILKHNIDKGPVVIDGKRAFKTLWEIIKIYGFPAVILFIYILRYYSFFTNPLWSSFSEYQTIFSANYIIN